ncbi:MAG: hypothetical protein RRX95_06305, partial [Oscillospiraceae bacterium]
MTPGKPKSKGIKSSTWKKVLNVIAVLMCIGVIVGSVAAVGLSMYLVKVTENDDQLLNLTNLKLSFTSIIYYQDPQTGE